MIMGAAPGCIGGRRSDPSMVKGEVRMEIRPWTYEEYPAFTEIPATAAVVPTTGDEMGSDYTPDVVYAERETGPLRLQLLTPKARKGIAGPVPCVVFVQGSAWKQQNLYREIPQWGRWASRGYVVAIVEYRPSSVAPFPAQIRDAQDAVWYLRDRHDEYGVDPERVVVAGCSSGGHTALFVPLLPAEAGEHAGTVPPVRGVISLYGALSLDDEDGFPSTGNHHLPDSPEGMLMGGINLREDPAARARATVRCHITADTAMPPVLLVHGTKDRTANPRLSAGLYKTLRSTGHACDLVMLDGADHGGPEFYTPRMLDIYQRFIESCCSAPATGR